MSDRSLVPSEPVPRVIVAATAVAMCRGGLVECVELACHLKLALCAFADRAPPSDLSEAAQLKIAQALGAKAETLGGLSGLGDLVLTCSSPQSRNMSFGAELGKGRKAAEVLSSRSAVTEGAATAPALVELAKRHGVEMPICAIVAEMVADRLSASDALTQLLERPFRGETD